MAYLSRIWINPWRRQTRRFLRDPQALHAAVLGGLPSQPVSERVLWRLDGGNEHMISEPTAAPPSDDTPLAHRLALYVVTRSTPSWEHLIEQAGWPSATDGEPQIETRSYEPLLARLQVDDHFAFRLTANPTRSVRQPGTNGSGKSRGKRVAHVTARQQLDWLLTKSEYLGFEIPASSVAPPSGETARDVKIANRQTRSFTKGKRGPHRVTVSTATFDGHLIVRDVDNLRAALLDGIGPAKAYGCGLLTLAPLQG